MKLGLKGNTKVLGPWLEGEYEGIGTLAVGYIEGDYPKTLPRRPGRVVKFA